MTRGSRPIALKAPPPRGAPRPRSRAAGTAPSRARRADRLDPLRVAARRPRSGAPSHRSGKYCGVSATAPTTTRSVAGRAPPRPPRTAGPRSSASGTCGTTAARGAGGTPHLDQQLVGRDAGLVVAEDQLVDRRPRARRAASAGPRARRARQHRRRVRRVVGVGEHAADRRLVAHARARDEPERARQHRPARRTTAERSTARWVTIAPSRSSPSPTSIPRSSSTRPSDRYADGLRKPWLIRMPRNVPPAEHRRARRRARPRARAPPRATPGAMPVRLQGHVPGSRRRPSCR